MMWGYWNGGPGIGWSMMAGMALFWVAVIAGIVLLVRASTHRHMVGAGGGDPALEILRRRYASGELTREEYERMRKDLS